MKISTSRFALVLALSSPALLPAQTMLSEMWGPQRGLHEITISAGGTSSRDFDDSIAALNLSYGYFFAQNIEGVIRQSIDYADNSSAGSAWSGSTRVAFDQHFLDGVLRPFLGVSFGRLYGETVRDTWAAGLEGGAKYYLQPRTFVHTTVEYGWLFDRARNLNNRFNDGQWSWSLGLGFNF